MHQLLGLLGRQHRIRAVPVAGDIPAVHGIRTAVPLQPMQPRQPQQVIAAVGQLRHQPVNVRPGGHERLIVPPQLCAVPQRVRQPQIADHQIFVGHHRLTRKSGGGGVGVLRRDARVMLGQNGSVQRHHRLNGLRVVGGEIRHAHAAHLGHIICVRHAVLIAGKVQLHAHRHRRQHQHHGRRLQPPALVEDAELLLQQHLRREEADHTQDHLADEQLRQIAVIQHRVVQEQAQAPAAAQTDAPPGDGPQPAEGHGVAGALAGPLLIQPPHQRQQHQAHRRVDGAGGVGRRRKM